MSDLIDRQAAIKAIDDLPNCYNGFSDTYDKAHIIGVLEELPTAEPRAITPDEFRDKMIEIRERNDSETEMTHIYMDKFMCETLKLLGYGEGVEVFEKQSKWYS